ncbi:hypothetical protein B0H11DRAFT_2049847 [Mycena galericulata]|nr:hypothetical protein B0H11DRAFT_2049847 [Mycena galericulata]
MAPIRLKTWVPRNTKPSFDWKARKSAEFDHFNIPFGIKELLQNVQGQALKDFQAREWNGLTGEDLRDKTKDEKAGRKLWLIETYPGLFTGPHGVSLKHEAFLPLYILSADTPVPSKPSNLQIAVVLWTAGGAMNALSFFNNHLDDDATFASFAVDGFSTSKENQLEKRMAQIMRLSPDLPLPGVSFRVGEQIGELKWKPSRKAGNPDTLRVFLDDLTTRTISEYLKHRYLADIDDAPDGGEPGFYDASMETAKMRDKAESVLKQARKRRVNFGMEGSDGKLVVKSDEVCITIIGIDPSLQPEKLFSAIFGIIPPPRQWRPGNGRVQFFFAEDRPTFYHRHQMVPRGIRLNRLSINYHGNLTISSERLMVANNDLQFMQYRIDVSVSADLAFRTIPDLAVELALDIITDGHSEALAGILMPRNKSGAKQYRAAFEAAMRKQHPLIPISTLLHPFARYDEDLRFFAQMGLAAIRVPYNALKIMYTSGAYVPVMEYARGVLLDSPPATDVKGLDRLRDALKMVIPDVPSDHITIRVYDKVLPIAVWDDTNKLFAFARPNPCEEHTDGECVCWIGPFLNEAAKDYKDDIPPRKLWSAYAHIVGGHLTLEPVNVDPPAPMAIDKPNTVHPAAVHAGPTTTARQADQSRANQASTSGKGNTVNGLAPSQTPRAAAANSQPTMNQIAVVYLAPPIQSPAHDIQQHANGVASAHTVPQPSLNATPVVSQDEGEAALNRQALAQISKAVLGYESLKNKYDAVASEAQSLRVTSASQQQRLEELMKVSGEKDGRIMELEEENKVLREDLEFYEDSVAKRKATRAEFKRQKTQ